MKKKKKGKAKEATQLCENLVVHDGMSRVGAGGSLAVFH